MRFLSTIAAVASFTATSALAQNAPANLERPNPPAVQDALRSARGLDESHIHRWQRELIAHLNKYKRDPTSRPDQGAEVVIRFVIDRTGHVVSAKVEKSSGDAVVDEAALAMLRRADPLPTPPRSATGEELTFVVPIRFVPLSPAVSHTRRLPRP